MPSDTEIFLKRAKRLVSVADRWRDSAEKVLYWAKCSVNHSGGSSYNDKALALVDRCFKVCPGQTDAMIRKDLVLIKKCFRDLERFYRTVKAGNGYLSAGPPMGNAYAYAIVNGWKRGDRQGVVFVVPRCKGETDEWLTDLITHESVHFAGGIDHYNIGGNKKNPAYGKKVFSLTNSQALKNTSSYSYFAYLARMPHTKWLTAT